MDDDGGEISKERMKKRKKRDLKFLGMWMKKIKKRKESDRRFRSVTL